MTVTIFHNPRCSKSRATLALIEDRGISPDIVDYLKAPPTAAELTAILKKLRLGPRDIIRSGEPVFKTLGLDKRTSSDDELIAAMAANPILIERPIVINGARATLGRPPEAVLAIL